MADSKVHSLTEKTAAFTGNDEFAISDSTASYETKRSKYSTLLSSLNALTYIDDFYVLIATVANQDYKLVVNCSFGGTITQVTTICVSGTATFTTKINTTALGGTANSVSTSEQSQTQSSSNVFVAGDDIVITASSNSACLRASVKIKYTRVLGLA